MNFPSIFLSRANSPNKTQQSSSQRRIAQKITYGNAIAVGVAVGVAILGSGIGLVIGDFYERKAQQQLEIANQQHSLLSKLQTRVLEVRSHPHRLMSVFGSAAGFEYERAKVGSYVNQLNALLTELREFVRINPQYLAEEADTLNILVQNYTTAIESYVKWTKLVWQQIDPGNLIPSAIPAARQRLWEMQQDKTMAANDIQFERLAERLDRLNQIALVQEKQAYLQEQAAAGIRFQIMIASMIISGLLAGSLAIFTGRAIATPLEKLNEVAQRVISETNFDLRAPVTTQDEVGSLATSLNQLLQWSGDYVRELQQTLDKLQETQAQLVHSEKMSSLGQLVAGIAHEINNPVSFIHGNLNHISGYMEDLLGLVQLYEQEYKPAITSEKIQQKLNEVDLEFIGADFPKLLNSMQSGTERIREIVKSLRNFSRLDEADLKAVDIHEGIDSTLMVLDHRLQATDNHPTIQVIRKYSQIPLLECYPGQLNQVFMNILSNAIDALDKGTGDQNTPPTITISTNVMDRKVRVRIADNGIGIPEEIRHRIFDPFFTTKPVGKGTGLGLSVSYKIVTEGHKGSLQCLSSLGKGAEFVIELPILNRKNAS